MMKYLMFSCVLLLFACDEQHTETNEMIAATDEKVEMDEVVAEEIEEELDIEDSVEDYKASMEKYREDATAIDPFVFEEGNGPLPAPSKEFLELKNKGEMYTFFQSGNEFATEDSYVYLALSTDSLDAKTIIAEDTTYYLRKWRQHFNYGITYEEEYLETGSAGVLKVRSTDKKAFLKVICPVIEYSSYNDGEEYVWDSDSTNYEPVEGGAGCYYNIERDSSTNFLSLSWYCGC